MRGLAVSPQPPSLQLACSRRLSCRTSGVSIHHRLQSLLVSRRLRCLQEGRLPDGLESEIETETSTSTSQASDADLPGVSREQILRAALTASGLMALFGGILRSQASLIATTVFGADSERTERLLVGGLHAHNLPVAIGAGLLVTGLRWVLLQAWPAFASASNVSNKQVLSQLAPHDLIVAAVFPAISEELLFRGALIPSVSPDWRGCLISGAVFGSLHVGGGRNWEFALWASGVGSLYGAVYLFSEDLAVPVVAHSLANLAAAWLWLRTHKSP